jgi:uncharacterized protein (DUF2267 family)
MTRERTMRTGARRFRFERYAEDGNRFLRMVARELGTADEYKALRITRAVLHALRDRLVPDDAVQFGQGLPMMLKGIYFDRYDISDTPVRIRTTGKFLDFIREKAGRTADFDMPGDRETIHAMQAVFFTLENYLDYGQLQQVKQMLNPEIVDLINAYPDVSVV